MSNHRISQDLNTSPNKKTYFPSQHHSFDIGLAAEFGIEEAIIIQHFIHWISLNKRMCKNNIEGRTWSYQTQKWMTAHFPYFKNEKKLCRLINSLIDKKVLMKGNFNKVKFDRTIWYAFVNEERFLQGVEEDKSLKGNELDENNESVESISQKCPMEESKVSNGLVRSVRPIPDTKNNSKNNTKESIGDTPKTPPLPKASCHQLKRRDHVNTSADEHSKLISKLGEEKTQACYDILNDWKMDTPKRHWKKNDFRSIIRWVVDAIEEKEKKSLKNDPEILAKKNRITAQEEYDKNHKMKNNLHVSIHLTGQQIEFIPTTPSHQPIVLSFTDKDFNRKWFQALNKFKLT